MSDQTVKFPVKMMEPSINSAIKKGYFSQVRYLVRYAPTLKTINRCDAVSGRTALCQCVFIEDITWSIGLAYILIENGAKVCVKDKHGMTALHWAAALGKHQLTRVFLACLDYNVNTTDVAGNTALHYATSRGHLHITECILSVISRFKQSATLRNAAGFSARDVAVNTRNFACVQVIAADVPCVAGVELPRPSSARATSRRSSTSSASSGGSACGGVCASRARVTRAASLTEMSTHAMTHATTNATTPATDNNGLLSVVGLHVDAWTMSKCIRNRPELLTTTVRPASPRLRLDKSDYRIWSGELTDHHQSDMDWRRQLKRIYTTFAYQFGESFLKQSAPRTHDPEIYYTDSAGISKPRASRNSEGGPFSPSNPAHNLFTEFKAAFSVSRRLSRRGSMSSQATGVTGKLGRRNSGVGSSLAAFRPSLGSRQSSVVGRSGSAAGHEMSASSAENSSKGGVSNSVAGVKAAAAATGSTPASSKKPPPASQAEVLARPVSRQGQYSDDVTAADVQNNADFLGSIKEHQENAAL